MLREYSTDVQSVKVSGKINSWGFAVTVEQMDQLAKDMGESRHNLAID